MTLRKTYTGKARYYARLGMTEAKAIRRGIEQLRDRQIERQKIEERAAAGGWKECDPGLWMLHQDDVLKAEVVKKRNRACFTAIVWHSDDIAECGSIALEIEAMRWCDDRLRAATLNARADEAKAGAVDDSALLAEARARDDKGWSH